MVGIRFVAPGTARNVYEIVDVFKEFKSDYVVRLYNPKKKTTIDMQYDNFDRMSRQYTLVTPSANA